MRSFFSTVILVSIICVLASCNMFSSTNNSNTSQSEQPQSSSEAFASSSTDDIRRITKPSEIIGTPDKIILVKKGIETIFEPQTNEYSDTIKMLDARLPAKLKESATAFEWLDDKRNIDWQLMSKGFDYLRLSYDDVQNIKIECMGDGHSKDYNPKISFQDIIFPLSGSIELFWVGKTNSFGKLIYPLTHYENYLS